MAFHFLKILRCQIPMFIYQVKVNFQTQFQKCLFFNKRKKTRIPTYFYEEQIIKVPNAVFLKQLPQLQRTLVIAIGYNQVWLTCDPSYMLYFIRDFAKMWWIIFICLDLFSKFLILLVFLIANSRYVWACCQGPYLSHITR